MIKLYQEALTESIKALFNSSGQIENYLLRLGQAKADYIAKRIIGKEFPLYTLRDSNKNYTGVYEDVPYKAIKINVRSNTYNLIRSVYNKDGLVSINILFMRSPKEILSSKLKLTDAEKKILRKMVTYYSVTEGVNPTWYNKQDLDGLQNELEDLKHHILVSISCTWSYNIEDFLKDDFLTRGLIAEKQIL